MDPNNGSQDGSKIPDGAQVPETSRSDIDLNEPIMYTSQSSSNDAIFSLPQNPHRQYATPALTRSTYTSSTTSSSRNRLHHVPGHFFPESFRNLVPGAPPETALYSDLLPEFDPEFDLWDMRHPNESRAIDHSELRSTSIRKSGGTVGSIYYSSIDSTMGDSLPDSRGLIEDLSIHQSSDTSVPAVKHHLAKEHPGESVDNPGKAAQDQRGECETPRANEIIERSIRKPTESVNMWDRHPPNAVCPECGKEVGRESDLKKHMKRHTKLYGCIWDGCDKSFGSKMDWKRHESTHGPLSKDSACCYRCIGDHNADDSNRNACLKVFYCDREGYREHLSRAGAQSSDEFIDSRCIASDFRGPFWCGFCNDVIAVSRDKDDTGEARLSHINRHLTKENMNIGDWYELNGNGLRKKELLGAAAFPNAKPSALNMQETTENAERLTPQSDKRDVLDHLEEEAGNDPHLVGQTPYSNLTTSEGGSLERQTSAETPLPEMQLDAPGLRFPMLGVSHRAGTVRPVPKSKEQRPAFDHVLSLTWSIQDSPSCGESGSELSETSSSDYTSYETTSAELQSFTIGCAVLVHILHQLAASKPHMLAPGGSDSSGTVSFPCEPQASSSQQTSTGPKRKTDGFERDDDEGDDLSGRKRQRQDGKTKNDSGGPRLACPFNKYDPHLFGQDSPEEDYHNCGLFNCDSIARLKQHLERAHYMPPFYCQRCCERGFKSHKEVNAHYRRQPSCEILEPSLYTERINDDLIVELELGKRNAKGTDPVQYWRKLYDAFFPGDAESRPISPYYEGPLAECDRALLNYSEPMLEDLVPVLTRSLGLSDVPTRWRRDLLQQAVQQFLGEILQRRRESLRGAMFPQIGRQSMDANQQVQTSGGDRDNGIGQVPRPQGTQIMPTNIGHRPEQQQQDLAIDEGVNNSIVQDRVIEDLPLEVPTNASGLQDAIAGSEDDLFGEQATAYDFTTAADFDFFNTQTPFFSSSWEADRQNFDLDAEVMTALAAQRYPA